jgi:hypothetical protein
MSLEDARAWMQDGDRLLRRAADRVGGGRVRSDSGEAAIAAHDYSRAAQMYLTGAVAYQHGREGVERSAGPSMDMRRLVDALDGRLRAEAEGAWRAARPDTGAMQTSESQRLASVQTFAGNLRDRFVRAAPELFESRRAEPPARDAAASLGR